MGKDRQGSAATGTWRNRALVSPAPLNRDMGSNRRTVAKWRGRAAAEDPKAGPTAPRATVLSKAAMAGRKAISSRLIAGFPSLRRSLPPRINSKKARAS